MSAYWLYVLLMAGERDKTALFIIQPQADWALVTDGMSKVS
ncbi:hypothetical protein AF72_03755 [Xylella taiwanensis]|uniref:Uncharacterized protein n=1 Tax=Xylella taiwanensis TaxID=1444770 RepID=Z9JJU8_9GAMM|nr:hypothetical protein [Xylella taiwanensis]EWS78690.1 hypothetical protein AF72_03755 [Xylella taiwanensis]